MTSVVGCQMGVDPRGAALASLRLPLALDRRRDYSRILPRSIFSLLGVSVLRRPVIAIALAAFIAAACSGGAGTSPAVLSSGSSSSASPAATRIDVSLTDALRIEPATLTVPAGVPVTFVVHNVGATDHEFYLGDEEAQADHAQEMASMGGMTHDKTSGIGVEPGETKELTYTFEEPGETLAGCHVAGHYGAGMKASIAVTD